MTFKRVLGKICLYATSSSLALSDGCRKANYVMYSRTNLLPFNAWPIFL